MAGTIKIKITVEGRDSEPLDTKNQRAPQLFLSSGVAEQRTISKSKLGDENEARLRVLLTRKRG